MDWTDCSSKTGRYRVPPSSDFQTLPLALPTNNVIFPEGSFVPAIAEMRPLIAAEPILRAPRPEKVAQLNGASSAREFVAAKQMATVSVNAERVSLTSILSQRERRSLLPEGEGEDEGFVPMSRDSDFKFEMSERKFSVRMIEEKLFRSRSREMKHRVIHRHVGFRFFNNGVLFVRIAFAPLFDRKWNEHGAVFLVFHDVRLHFLRANV